MLALALALASTVAGCGSKSGGTTSTASTTATALGAARAGLSVASSVLGTTAPDAKLLVIQTEGPVTATSTPVWGYLFGSPKSDKTYLVRVTNGKAMPASEYGAAGLSAKEWSAVPSPDAWKTDSDVAYKTAMTAAGAKPSAAYTMGFLTYVPASDAKSGTKPFVWYVSFDPASQPATATVEVDAKTGAVVAK